ncbi:putative ATPase (AAA+ superfamily) 6 [Thermococcus cleftensis]|uniref:ATPase (AAA+ superfamily) 6 n=1 Tax=Thermococcus cleftensis (strain DSM 27260 / KACC 17922 / CL1) TaxID=163003 RepID=I3ZTZ8_THECF|nr:ATP-binding protein [Thermococcus cleftensis]AFL95182.1 putative ATPase (AAA+ superfamily) 6 [Thermococcus cleftensis]
MVLKFIDRDDELKALEGLYSQGKAQFVLIYGRRRIGKTELVKRFIEGKKSFYFLARKEPMELELERIVRSFNRRFNVFIEARNLEEFFEEVANFGRLVFVIDEFPYWVEEDRSIPSTFQYIWDEILRESQVMLILLGSSISTMEGLMSYKNPLYGRRTAQLKLSALGFFHLRDAFSRYSWEELVKVYGTIDGIPAYIQYFDDSLSVEENIERNFYRRVSVLYEDAERLLKDELREPITYLNILKAINDGKTKLTEIANETKVAVTNLPKYLKTLETLDLVYREFPVTVRERKRFGVYRVRDFYYRFWLRFVYPYRDDIEIGAIRFEDFRDDFNKYLGEVFESVAREFLIRLNSKNELPFRFTKIGRWWDRREEIDLVALNSLNGEAGLFEVKWKELSRRGALKVLRTLEEKGEKADLGKRRYYGMIAKRVEGKEELRKEGYLVFDLKDFGGATR